MIKQIIQTAGARILNVLVNLAILFISTHQLGAEALGNIGLILLDISIIMLLGDLVCGSPSVYYSSRTNLRNLVIKGYVWTIMVALFTTALVWILWQFPSLYHKIIPLHFGPHILILAIINILSNFNLNILVGHEKISAYNRVFSLQYTFQLIVFSSLIFLLNRQNLNSYVIALYAAYGSAYIAGTLAIIPLLMHDKSPVRKNILYQIFSFGAYAQVSNTLHLLNKRFSFWVLNYTLGTARLGIFNAGTQLTEGLRIIGNSIAVVQFSHISKSNDRLFAIRLTLQLLRFNLILTLLALLVIIAMPSSLFVWLLGPDFAHVKPIIISLAPGVLALAATVILAHFFSGTGQPKINTWGSAVGFMVMIIAVYPLTRYFGAIGAGITASITYTANALYFWIMFHKQTQCHWAELIPGNADITFARQELKTILKRMKK